MCTTFSVCKNNNTFILRTMDLEKYHEYEFKFFPSGYNYENDVFGNKLYTKYKIMGTTFKNYDHLLDGINEEGLLGCTNSFRNQITFVKNANYKKINLTSTKLLNVFLTNCKNLDEVKELSKKIFILKESFVDKDNFSRHYHYMFTDKNNHSLIVEIEDGNLKVHENTYNIMTNSPKFEIHIKNLKKYIKDSILKGSLLTPTKRFLRAYDELININKEILETDTLDFLFKSLEKFKISKSDYDDFSPKKDNITLYYSIISAIDKKYYLKYTNSKFINCFSFDDFKNQDVKKIIMPLTF